jgi:pyruvate carboxylase
MCDQGFPRLWTITAKSRNSSFLTVLLQVLVRGANAVGYTSYPDNV